MKKLKLAVMTLAILLFAGNIASAEGIGYIDYQRVVESTPFARDAMKAIDAKALELQQYLVDKEKEYKAIDTPVQKKNFQDSSQTTLGGEVRKLLIEVIFMFHLS